MALGQKDRCPGPYRAYRFRAAGLELSADISPHRRPDLRPIPVPWSQTLAGGPVPHPAQPTNLGAPGLDFQPWDARKSLLVRPVALLVLLSAAARAGIVGGGTRSPYRQTRSGKRGG